MRLLDDRHRVIVAGIAALILTVGLARFAYTPLLPIMRAETWLTDSAGGWLATFNYMGYITGAVAAASISSLPIKYRLYKAGLLLAVLTTAATGLTQDYTTWIVLRFLSGLSSTAGLLIGSGLVLNWLIRHGHKPELGLHFGGIGLGIVVSGLAVAGFVGFTDWSGQWLWLGALGLLFFLPAWFWLPAPPAQVPGGPAVKAGGLSRWMLLFMAAYFCAGFGYVVSATFIVAILEKQPLLAGHGSLVWVLVGLAAAPSCFFWDRISSGLGQVPALLLAYGLQVLAILAPAWTDGAAVNVFAALLFGGTFMGIVSLALSIVGRLHPANPAKAMARLTLSYGVAQIVAPALAGHMAQETGSFRGALYLAALVMVLGMGLLLALARQKHPSVEQQAELPPRAAAPCSSGR